MNDISKIAKHFIKQDQLSLAHKMILIDTPENSIDNERLYLGSLLCRYHDDYDTEKRIIDAALSLDSHDAYMQKRLQWHQSSWFNKSVARPQKLSKHIAPQETEMIQNMTFVTGADSNPIYFNLLIELLDSLANLPKYKNVDIHIIDCGMKQDQKQFLAQQFPAIKNFIAGHWEAANPHPILGYQLLVARMYLDKYLPDYRYLFFIDADTWVQDENCLDRYLALTKAQGFACAYDMSLSSFYGSLGCASHLIAKEDFDEQFFKSIPYCNAGVVCMDSSGKFLKEWRRYFENNMKQNPFCFQCDQSVMHCAMKQKKPPVLLDSRNNCLLADIYKSAFYIKNDGWLRIDQQILTDTFNNPALHNPIENKAYLKYDDGNDDCIVGLIHLADVTKNWAHKQMTIFNRESGKIENTFFSYRVYPFQDKLDIRKELINIK